MSAMSSREERSDDRSGLELRGEEDKAKYIYGNIR